MKLSLNRNLQIGYGFSLVVIIIISIASYLSIRFLLNSAALVDHSNLVIQKLENTASIMKDAETGQRGYLLTKREEFLEPYNGAYTKALNQIQQVQQLTVDNPEQQRNIAEVKRFLKTRLSILQQILDKYKSDQKVNIDDLARGKLAMDALRQQINIAETDETKLLNARVGTYKTYTTYVPVIIVIAALLGLIFTIVSYISVTNIIAGRTKMQNDLKNKEHETAELNEELAAANEEMTAINEELLASNEELSVSQYNLHGLNNDLEERVAARTEALSLSETRFRKIMQTIPQIAWTNTASGEVDFYNQQWFDYTGLTFDETKDWGWREVIHPDDIMHNLQRFRAIIDSKESGEFEIREKRFDGEYRWHLVRMAPLKNHNGEVQLWVGTATDIQEIKQLQQQKDDFINIASHELKTPLTSLKSSVQLIHTMKDRLSPEKMDDLVIRANKGVNKVAYLIEDLLYIGKLNQGQLDLNKTSITLSRIINDSSNHIKISGIYKVITTGDMALQVFADGERIEQVVVNFVNNAIKYAPLSKEIYIDITKDDTMAKVSVTDKGPGISHEKLPFLFDRYFRVQSSGSQYSGLGIGLYISAEIIKKHNGEIGADSKPGEGSTFWFTLPLQAK
ncbi:CHASE3 domain-containing protein [Mucilaginibacter sp.]|uniref:sensor histidine kinase n=1 Tax=Mucilaginibacter sp. TaxID=1882438 RepID=UPI0025F7F3CE|nr:CHASE3 domain-containing protein [Mucilaginibacter sp.]